MLVVLVVVALAFIVNKLLGNDEVFSAFIVALIQLVLLVWHFSLIKTP